MPLCKDRSECLLFHPPTHALIGGRGRNISPRGERPDSVKQDDFNRVPHRYIAQIFWAAVKNAQKNPALVHRRGALSMIYGCRHAPRRLCSKCSCPCEDFAASMRRASRALAGRPTCFSPMPICRNRHRSRSPCCFPTPRSRSFFMPIGAGECTKPAISASRSPWLSRTAATTEQQKNIAEDAASLVEVDYYILPRLFSPMCRDADRSRPALRRPCRDAVPTRRLDIPSQTIHSISPIIPRNLFPPTPAHFLRKAFTPICVVSVLHGMARRTSIAPMM